MKLSEQVTALENRLKLAEDELQRIKGVICVNFVDYEGSKAVNTPNLWGSLEEFRKQSVFSMVMEVFTHYVNQNETNQLHNVSKE